MFSLIKITSRAERQLKRLDRPTKNRIIPAIYALADILVRPVVRK